MNDVGNVHPSQLDLAHGIAVRKRLRIWDGHIYHYEFPGEKVGNKCEK